MLLSSLDTYYIENHYLAKLVHELKFVCSKYDYLLRKFCRQGGLWGGGRSGVEESYVE